VARQTDAASAAATNVRRAKRSICASGPSTANTGVAHYPPFARGAAAMASCRGLRMVGLGERLAAIRSKTGRKVGDLGGLVQASRVGLRPAVGGLHDWNRDSAGDRAFL